MDYFRDKNILITGAFGGFGSRFASQLAESGARLILTDAPGSPAFDPAKASGLPGIDPARAGQVIAMIPADLSTAEGCRALHEECRKLGVALDVVIHNAGIGFGGCYNDVPLENNEKIISVNLLSVMRLNSLLLPEMIRRRSGHIIYVSSVAGFVATPLGVAYSTSKFGLRAFAMALHGEIRRHGIRTSIVYPFWSRTPIMKSQVFGNPELRTMPDFYASSPDRVVSCTLKGAARNRLHICPGFFSRVMWYAVRFYPIIAAQRLMRDDLIKN
jgi:short-subunit dehydrogenase